MIYLKNIKKEKNRIVADYYPEDSKKFSRISISTIDFNDFQGELVGYDLECKNHLNHAKFALIEMAEGKRPIADCQIMWY